MKRVIGFFLLVANVACQSDASPRLIKDETNEWIKVCIDGRVFYKKANPFNYYLPKIKPFGYPVYCSEEK